MPRKARKDLHTPFLHMMVQGVNKEFIFSKKEYIEKYLKIIKENNKKYDITIIAYCIMNNHAHFLVYAEDYEILGKFMHKNNLQYAQMYNKAENRCGVLFRNRYKTEPIYNIKYLINCIKYIHNNPVKAQMVLKCKDYPYSSYHDYEYNSGVAKNKIMSDIFGKDCDYIKLFEEASERRYIDVEEDNKSEDLYISEGIREYIREFSINIVDIFLERTVLKELIRFLYSEWKIKYVEIQDYFGISRGTMKLLK